MFLPGSVCNTCNTLARTGNVINNVRVTMHFLAEIIFTLRATKFDKFDFKGSYDKQNLTPVVNSYEIYETRRRLVS